MKMRQDLNYTKQDPEAKLFKQSDKGKLFTRGFDEKIEVSQLHEAFSNFNKIISCEIPLTNGRSNVFAKAAEKARIDFA